VKFYGQTIFRASEVGPIKKIVAGITICYNFRHSETRFNKMNQGLPPRKFRDFTFALP
jgi:hypothetical protein